MLYMALLLRSPQFGEVIVFATKSVIPGRPGGSGPEPMNTCLSLDLARRCSWIPGSQALGPAVGPTRGPAPRNDGCAAFSLARSAVTQCVAQHPRRGGCERGHQLRQGGEITLARQ